MANEQPRKVDIGAPLSVDIIYQLINSSIQSGKPLYLPNANLSGANLLGANLSGANRARAHFGAGQLIPGSADRSGRGWTHSLRD